MSDNPNGAGRQYTEQLLLRLPPGMRQRLTERAEVTHRSVSAEIIDAIEKHLAGPSQLEDILARLAKLEARVHQ